MIKPLLDYVLLEKLPSEKKVGSIYLASEKKAGNIATVVAVSTSKDKDGKQVELSVKVGDKVIYREYSGTEYEENEHKYLLIKNEDILAIVE